MSQLRLAANLPGMLHAGVKAGPEKSKKGGKKRKAALMERGRFWQEIQKHRTVEKLFEKYDVSQTGYLNATEVAKFLQDAAKGQAPSEEEVQFVMLTTHDKTGIEGKGITVSEIKTALDVWRAWEQLKPEMDTYMKKYDTNHSGKLEIDQLKLLLTELNEGEEPSDAEVKWVMDGADGIYGAAKTGGVNKSELQGAITMWYTHVEEEGGDAGGPDAAKVEGGSSCCVVS